MCHSPSPLMCVWRRGGGEGRESVLCVQGTCLECNSSFHAVPGVPGGADFCLVYESPSYLLGQLTVQVEIPVSRQYTCKLQRLQGSGYTVFMGTLCRILLTKRTFSDVGVLMAPP